MGKYLVAEDRYILINVYSDGEGNIKDFTVDYKGLSLGEYANLLGNALVRQALSLGIDKEDLRNAINDGIIELYEAMGGGECD